MSNRCGSIARIAKALALEVAVLEKQRKQKEVLLEELQELCDHPNVKVYRGMHRAGTCEFCLHKFLTEAEVDRIFSE